MVLILDVNWMLTQKQVLTCIVKIGNLICSRHLSRSTALPDFQLFDKKTVFIHTFATESELPSTISAMLHLDF